MDRCLHQVGSLKGLGRGASFYFTHRILWPTQLAAETAGVRLLVKCADAAHARRAFTASVSVPFCPGCTLIFFSKSTECQAVDWPTHRRSCTPESAASLNHHLIAKYVAKHHHNYTDFALEALGFFTSYHHLEGHHRALFMHTGTRFLHVILQRVNSPGRGAHNKLEFANAAVRDTSHLELAEMLVTRLTAHFPSVLLGFTVFDPLGHPGIRVTTVTHTFVWPGPAATSVGAHKVIEDIVDAESELQKIGKT